MHVYFIIKFQNFYIFYIIIYLLSPNYQSLTPPLHIFLRNCKITKSFPHTQNFLSFVSLTPKNKTQAADQSGPAADNFRKKKSVL